MYTVDERDRVVELSDVPQSDVGAPCPLVLASEGKLIAVYFVSNPPVGWNGTTVTVVGPGTPGEPAAIIRFSQVEASMFGPPNDEAFSGHPLASRGLHPYGAFEVFDSSWVRRLEGMNAVHPQHRPESYASPPPGKPREDVHLRPRVGGVVADHQQVERRVLGQLPGVAAQAG